ncbi:glutathione S-transferase, partial [Aspergillus sclerotioniger CBS 115572]
STEVKKEPFVLINPNGRLPAIEDTNTGIILWKSGAIVEYLVETYDKDNKINFQAGNPEYFHAKQWIHPQVSKQGPYFGQAHPKNIPSAKERYKNEVLRMSEILNNVPRDREYLADRRFSYADASFLPCYNVFGHVADNEIDLEKEFPNLNSWLERMRERPAMVKISKDKENALANQLR